MATRGLRHVQNVTLILDTRVMLDNYVSEASTHNQGPIGNAVGIINLLALLHLQGLTNKTSGRALLNA